MKILNLGCGTKVSSSPDVVNIDWSIYLRLKRIPVVRSVVPLLFGGIRRRRFNSLPANILVHDLSRGIPFEPDSVDVIYHSHFLEHLDKPVAKVFLAEARRALKPGGIHRIVVPDFEYLCRDYLRHVDRCIEDSSAISEHDRFIAEIVEQSVRREAIGTSQQGALWRTMENMIRGDARRRGETHQWMYDKFNLSALLLEAGYRNPVVCRYDTSSVADWPMYGLDMDEAGNEYKPASLYIEAMK